MTCSSLSIFLIFWSLNVAIWNFTKIFINWYERLYHWCVSIIAMLIFIKSMVGSSITLSIAREGYWVYEKVVIYSSFFEFSSQNFIKWYERLYHWYASNILKLIFIKWILGSSFSLCIMREEYWVYEKYHILMLIYAFFPFSRYNLYNSIWAPLSFMHQQHPDV